MSLRLCWVGSHSTHGAAYLSVGELLAPQFTQDGHTVLLTSRKRGRLAKLHDMTRTLKREAHNYDIVVIDVFSTAALWYARITSRVAKGLGKLVVLVLHGGNLPSLVAKRPKPLRTLLHRADRVVAPTPYLAREVCEPLDVPATVIANPVALDGLTYRERTSVQPHLLWVRSFRQVYRPDNAVRVLASLRKSHSDATLTMVGPDHDGSLSKTMQLAADLGVADAVTFTGLIDRTEINRLGQAADIFFNTSSIDNSPISVVEALAMGLCVVSTKVGGILDLLTHQQDALLVPPDDSGAMAAAVDQLCGDSALAQRLSQCGKITAARHATPAVAATWYTLLSDLVTPPHPVPTR